MPGHTEKFAVTVGDFVAADLQGDEAFEINAQSPRTQTVHLGAPFPSTIWRWDVKAVRGGDHVMVIRTAMQVKDHEGNYHDVVATSQPYSFHVKIGVAGWLKDTLGAVPVWAKLIAGALGGVTLVLLAVGKLRNALLIALGIKKDGAGGDKPPSDG
jgi:hypothetical protein